MARPDVTTALEIRGLTKAYGAQRGVQDVSLRLEAGERVGLLGPNGSGKTTLIRAVLGLLRPDAGSVTVMGRDVQGARMDALAQVGYLPGELALIGGLSGHRTLDLLGRLHPRPPVLRDELRDVLGLSRRDLARPVRQYSRGMKQKLGVIAALQHDPPVAILDEPTGGLDPVVQLRLLTWLAGAADRGMAVLLSSHVLDEVETLCDRVALLRDGRLAATRPVHMAEAEGVRRVHVSFAGPVHPDAYAVAGVSPPRVSGDGRTHAFALSAPPGPLLDALARLEVTALTVTGDSLQDTVRDLYRTEAV